MDILMSDVQRWATDSALSDNASEYLRKLLKGVDQCVRSTGDVKIWASKLQNDHGLKTFLRGIMSKRQDFTPTLLADISNNLEMLISKTGHHNSDLKGEIGLWIKHNKDRDIPSLHKQSVDENVDSIPALVDFINDHVLPRLGANEPEATRIFTVALHQLQKSLEKKGQTYGLFILYCSLLHLDYSAKNRLFCSFPTRERTELVCVRLQEMWQKTVQEKDDLALQIFLVRQLAKTVQNTKETEEGRDSRFQNGIMVLGTILTPKIQDIISHLPAPIDLNRVKSVLLSEGVPLIELRDVLNTKRVDIKQAMKTPGLDKKYKGLLDKLGLTSHYPEKITLQKAITIGEQGNIHDQKQQPWQLLKRIIMLDHKGIHGIFDRVNQKDTKTAQTKGTCQEFLQGTVKQKSVQASDTPDFLDVFVATYACCDLLLKQVLLQKMFLCRLAVPLISPMLSNDNLFSLWALRTINIESEGTEVPVVEKDVKAVIFLRFSQSSYSKSALMNGIISDKSHCTFQRRKRPDSKESLSNGLVEAQWYLPGEENPDFGDNVVMFLNVRGDATHQKMQMEVLKEIPSTYVCIIDESELTDTHVQQTMKQVHKLPTNVILFISMKEFDCMNRDETINRMKDHLSAYFEAVGNEYQSVTPFTTQVDLETGIERPTLINDVKDNLAKVLVSQKCFKLDSILRRIKDIDGIKVDEGDQRCKKAELLANMVFSLVKDQKPSEYKRKMLPLQEVYWPKITEIERMQKNMEKDRESLTVKKSDDLEKEMESLRIKQLGACADLSPLMKAFIQGMVQVEGSDIELLYYQWLKLHFDGQSRRVLPEMHEQYHMLWKKLRSLEKGHEKEEALRMKCELATQKKLIGEASVGVEHLFRETAQIYEAVVESRTGSLKKEIIKLPRCAAELLHKGQALELMDGDAANVPLVWVKAVFSELEKIAPRKRVMVTSVLGVQSSGKSTLLNTMFGLQFLVSAGRCTRGVYMQLLKVDSQSTRLPYDYILVCDTEGLRCVESKQQMYGNDNKLATFVVGLADISLINVKGENISEISDVLQIAVHALLRMKQSDKLKSHRTCNFIHQNVSAGNANLKTRQDIHSLEETLDEMTKEACIMESVLDINSFNDIIRFDSEKHVWHVVDLWLGNPPMAPINPGYTKKVRTIKEQLVSELTNLGFMSFSETYVQLEDMWNGVLAENFVFSFRNTLEAKAYNILEAFVCEKIWTVKKQITDWFSEYAMVRIKRSNVAELNDLQTNLLHEIESIVRNKTQNASSALEAFYEAKKQYKDLFIHWRERKSRLLEDDIALKKKEVKEKIEYEIENRRLQIRAMEKLEGLSNEVLIRAKKEAEKMKGTHLRKDMVKKRFNQFWIECVSDLAPKTEARSVNIANGLENVLWNILDKDNKFVKDELAGTLLKPAGWKYLFTVDKVKDEDLSIGTIDKLRGKKQEIKHKAVRSINEKLTGVDKEIKSLLHKDSDFQEEFGHDIVKNVCVSIDNENKKLTKFGFTQKMRVKLAVHVCRYALPQFEKSHREHRNRNDMRKQLEKRREETWSLYRNTAIQSANEVCAADALTSHLQGLIRDALQRRVTDEVISHMVRHLGYQKYHLLLKILGGLAKGGFNGYKAFIDNPAAYAYEQMKVWTVKEIFHTKARGLTQYNKCINICLKDIMDKIKSAMTMTTASTVECWIQRFCGNITVLPVTEEGLRHMKQWKITDFSHFQEVSFKNMVELENQLETEAGDINENTMVWNGDDPFESIFDSTWGCRAHCPLCHEPCMKSDPDHKDESDPHQCIQHRPTCVSGVRNIYTNVLTIESCNFKVQSKNTFQFSGLSECVENATCSTAEDGVYHPYQDYKKFLPDWDIAPRTAIKSSKYWIWFVATYKQELADWHKAKVPEIPESWNKVTKKEALDSLRKILN